MRILFLQDHLRIGGTEKQTLALASFGQEHGFETGVIVFRPGGTLSPTPGSSHFYKVLQPFNTRIDEWAPGLVRWIGSFQPDVIVFMGKVAHLFFISIRKYFPAVTLVATYRSGKPPVPYYARALQQADGLISNSQVEHKRLAQTLAIPPDRVKTVHNGCLLPSMLKKDTNPASSLRLLCSAMFRPQKNQLELLSILAKLPAKIDWHCTFAGSGKMLKACKSLSRKLGLESRVTFTWSADPQSLYADHDLALLTSDKEGMPNSLIEAQCAGLPVVAYLVNGVKESFEEGVSGYGIPFGDQQAFLDALLLLASNTEKLKQMSEAALIFGREHFGFAERSTDFFEALRKFHKARRRE
ncbi:MAG: glycosyltransferase [Verrucomicrobia bacterium]|nr:glycosyltransferase [Verrucomicrobiota bacterium]